MGVFCSVAGVRVWAHTWATLYGTFLMKCMHVYSVVTGKTVIFKHRIVVVMSAGGVYELLRHSVGLYPDGRL